MFKHILIATDGSPLSERAALRGVHLAQKHARRAFATIGNNCLEASVRATNQMVAGSQIWSVEATNPGNIAKPN